MTACPAMTTCAVRSVRSPRIGRSRWLSRPSSARSDCWHAARRAIAENLIRAGQNRVYRSWPAWPYTLGKRDDCSAMMAGCAVTTRVPRCYARLRAAPAATSQRPRQGRRDPCPAPSACRAAAPTGTPHGAFRDGIDGPSASPIFPDQKAPLIYRPALRAALTKGRG